MPVSDMKAVAIMVLQTSKTESKIMTLEEFGQDVMRRRAALGGDINMPRNSGKRRTESKKVLLAAIEAAGGKW
jgi:hypothetical protein